MNPQEFDALLSSSTGFYTQNQMVASGVNNQMVQQSLQNVQTMQTQVPIGNVPEQPSNPLFEQIYQKSTDQFYVLINNEQKGPFSLEQLKGLAIADIITPQSMVWSQGMPQWTELKTCLAALGKGC